MFPGLVAENQPYYKDSIWAAISTMDSPFFNETIQQNKFGEINDSLE
jgi:hypothetical protein